MLAVCIKIDRCLRAIRLIAADLDGTLLRDDKTISPRTRRALDAAEQAGYAVVLVTARPPRFLRRLAAGASLSELAICCNGASIYDLHEDRIVEHTPIDHQIIGDLVHDLRTAISDVCFAAELGLRYGWEPAYAASPGAMIEGDGIEGDVLQICTEPVTKLIVHHPELPLPSLHQAVSRIAGGAYQVSYSGAPFIEISAAGVHKAAALQSLADRLGIQPAEAIAFGGMPIDLPMPSYAGRSVAVANAHPDVLEAADETTLSNEDDGVAHTLERLQLLA